MPIRSRSNGRCVKTQFEREILCAGTMTDWVEILSRSIQGLQPGVSIQPTESFTAVSSVPGYLEATQFTFRTAGVSTADQSVANYTHVAYINFDQTIYELDESKLFVKLTRTRDRYFKLKGVKNFGEQDEYLQLLLAETGFTDLEAAHG